MKGSDIITAEVIIGKGEGTDIKPTGTFTENTGTWDRKVITIR